MAATPNRSPNASPTSSPSNLHANGSPQQLTPRSKIKAMLAAVDDESYSESNVETAEKQQKKNHVTTTSTDIASVNSSGREREDYDQSDSDVAPLLPRGRLAARLHAQKSPNSLRSDSDAESEKEIQADAYQRIRKKLLSGKGSNQAQSSPPPALQMNHDEDAHSGPAHRPQELQIESQSPGSSLPATPATVARNDRPSPGLFVTPEQPSSSMAAKERAGNDESESDLPTDPQKNERFLALVARKRAEREAKQAAEDEKRAARETREQSRHLSRLRELPIGSSEDDSDNNAGGRKLTQQARPTRKASKKALEEMNRETQRMNRNMQLAHQAKTKKKITKESLFARFNFRTSIPPNTDAPLTLSSSTAVSSMPPSDTENAQPQATPPSSPPESTELPEKRTDANIAVAPMYETSEPHVTNEAEYELPSMQDVMSQPQRVSDIGKGKATDAAPAMIKAPTKATKSAPLPRPFRVRLPRPHVRSRQGNIDSDSDLEIMPAGNRKSSKIDVFDRLPTGKASETRSLQTLRALAHLHSPPGKQSGKQKPSMTLSDMQMSLQQRARQQAAAERAEKIRELKIKGVIIQTAEERQKDQADIEDLVEKARREADEIKKMEKDAAKKARKANGEADASDDTSDDDGDYQEDAADEAEVELSGSDEEAMSEGQASKSEQSEDESREEDENEGGVKLDDDRLAANGFVEDEAMEDAEAESSTGEKEDETADEGNDDTPRLPKPQRRPRVSRIIESDDEDGDPSVAPTQNNASASGSSEAVIPSLAMAGKTALPMMGMTQAFAATMADSQTQVPSNGDFDEEQDSLSFLGPVPQPDFPVFDVNDTDAMVIDSQDSNPDSGLNTATNPDISLGYSQSQLQYDTSKESQNWPAATQDDDVPDPTQDVGFGMSSPAAVRFVSVPPSAVATVLLPDATSPTSKKKGRLQRGKKPMADEAGDDENVSTISGHAAVTDEITANAFDVLKKKRHTTATVKPFDKKKSEAKEMVEDQALESEDEYAGIGGASDDESGGSEDEEVRKMIEHGDVDVDERKMAAFYADKERDRDNAAISKLYKDITSGGLRRNRGGADLDLSDSDDDTEARQRARRLKEAKLRKALLEDERVGKIAEDPKKMAFLRAIEDWDEGEGFLLDEPEPDTPQTEESTQEAAASQRAQQAGQKRKRPLSDSVPDAGNRPAPAARRTKGKKPATLAEIRESVSFLIETPESASFVTNVSSPPESEDENAAPRSEQSADRNEEDTAAMPPPPTTQNPRRSGASAFTDRLALLRSSTSATSSSRMAFAPNASSSSDSFRVPSLLRRASTSNLANAMDANGISHLAATEQAAGGEQRGFASKKGGRKGCSISGAAREVERRAVLEGVERRRKEERERIAKVRRSGMGVLGARDGWEA